MPKARKNKRRQMVDDFAYLNNQKQAVVPTKEERDAFWEALLVKELPPEAERTRQTCGTRRKAGRPPKITEQGQKFLLHALRIGCPRKEIARRLGIDASTITKFVQRDPALAKEVIAAEEAGRRFLRVYHRLFYCELVVVDSEPTVGTLYFEREKEYLIQCGLPVEWVRRLRQRTGQELHKALFAKKATEKVLRRVEKQVAQMLCDDAKSQPDGKIVRRSFFNRSGQPVEEIEYTVEKHPSDAEGKGLNLQAMLDKVVM